MKKFGGYAEDVLKGIWSNVTSIEITALVDDGEGCTIDLALSKEYPSITWKTAFYCVHARMRPNTQGYQQFWCIGDFETKDEAATYADDIAWKSGVDVVDLCASTLQPRVGGESACAS